MTVGDEVEVGAVAHAEANGTLILYSISAYAGPYDDGILMAGQRVGEAVRTRPMFMVTRDGANTQFDPMPSGEYRRDREAWAGVV